jgi:hypothetical protein
VITLTTKSNNINLATTPGSVEVGEQGKDNINLAANENSINLQTEKERIEFNSTKYLKGDKGEPGADGFSPIVEVEEVDGGHSISITDATGTDTFIVKDGSSEEHDCAQSDWNVNNKADPSYIHNRTHYVKDSTVISWNGYFEENHIIHESEYSITQLAKITDDYVDTDKLINITPADVNMRYHSIPGNYEDWEEGLYEFMGKNEWDYVEDNDEYTWLSDMILYVKVFDAEVYHDEYGYIWGLTPGLYVYYYTDQDTCMYISKITIPGDVVKIDVKYMPDEVFLNDGDNIVIEDAAINVYTNTGYAISDKDIKLQPILAGASLLDNHMVYTDNEVIIIYNGSNYIRRSVNGIDFERITLPYACKSMCYNPVFKRVYGLCVGYFIYSDDDGLTWQTKQSTLANGDYICRGESHIKGFRLVNKTTRRITSITETFGQNTYITSTITPAFITQFAQHQFIWCNSAGTFKYGAGSQEGNFPSLSGITVSCLKNIEGYPIVGLRNSNKIYRLKNYSGVGNSNEWVAYTLPSTCSVNDITFNPYDKTYYIFNTVCAYFKTKDFIEYETVYSANYSQIIEAQFTLMGIQATIKSKPNELLLAPTRTKLENKAQEWDRALNKDRWAGNGLVVDGEKIHINAQAPLLANDNGLMITQLEEHNLPEKALEAMYVSTAPIHLDFDPYSMDAWYWEFGFPTDIYSAHKIVFNQEGSFFDQMNWETEYFVEQYEYGYIFSDYESMKYVKLGNLAPLFN